MQRHPFALSLICAGTLVCAGGCSRDKTDNVEVQSKTPVQAVNQPVTVSGCLRAGVADNTFVLTAQATNASQPATYQLIAGQDLNLREHIGHQVEVNGVVTAQQQAESVSAPVAEKPTGTSGTPTVQTSTEVDMKRLDVSAVKPLSDHCEK